MKVIGIMALLLAGAAVGGCGAVVVTDFPNRLIGSDGQLLVLDDLEAIASDPDLTDDEKRARLRDLGMEDEKLIDALLTL